MGQIDVTTLGTGSPIPDPTRAGPSTLVRAEGANLLFDCGRGVLMRLAGAGLMPPALHQVFLTHLHSDHVTDFNDLLTTRWVMSPTPAPLPVAGPPGTAAFASRTVEMLRDDVGYRIAHHETLDWEPGCEVTEVLEGAAPGTADVRVLAAPTDHRPVAPTVGYRVEHDGKAVVIAGDTVPCEGVDRLCAGADIYVQTVIRDDLIRQIGFPRLVDVLDYHSTVADAARTAARAEVRTLVLTHPVPPPAPGTEQEWLDQAAEHFDGEVLLASDLMTVSA
jgi:ribonuclease Z